MGGRVHRPGSAAPRRAGGLARGGARSAAAWTCYFPSGTSHLIAMRYDPAVIEPKWQQIWEERRVFCAPTDPTELAARPKYYVLDMFPYPSGAGLHVGHPEGYTGTDVLARLKRMQGYNVLHPMGWDAFGLPAERAAMRENIHPAIITKRNIDTFRRQIKRLGFSYDWEREISTARSRLLQVDAVDLPQALRARPRVRGRDAGQLVSRARHRARQRGGEGRPLRRDRRPGASAA